MKRKIMVCLFVMTLLIGLRPVNVAAQDSTIDGLNLNVNMVIREDGSIEVTEQARVYFNNMQQGIFVVLPQFYGDFKVQRWTGIDNDKRNYFFRISDFRSSTHEVTEDDASSSFSDLVFRLGTAGTFLTGENTFEYSYTIHTQDLNLDLDYDLLFLNIKGQGWNFDFESVDFSITFEKDLPESFPVEVQAGTQDVYDVVELHRDGNTLSGSIGLSKTYESVSIMAHLPQGFFVFPNQDFTLFGYAAFVAVIVILALLFMKHGRDYPLVESVEFSGPDGLSSAEVAYIYNGYVQAKDVTSLIILWASQGFLTLEELDEDNVQITKTAEYRGHNLEEERLFNGLFELGETVTTKQLTNKFGTKVAFAVNNIPLYFRKNPDKKVFDTTSLTWKVLGSMLLAFVFGLYCGLVVHATYGFIGFSVIGFGVGFVVCLIMTVVAGLAIPRLTHRKALGKVGISVLSGMLSLLVTTILGLIGIALGVQTQLAQIVLVSVLLMIGLILAGSMDRRTQQGMRWFGQILGLKRFIEVAEHDRLVKLAEETPSIFYDILPFAYVLGVTDVWSKKFESIAIETPDWYHSTSTTANLNSIYMWSMLNHSMSTMQRSMITEPIQSTSSGRGLGGGGGFGGGSSGGGGFSGGGFGGSGGGGW